MKKPLSLITKSVLSLILTFLFAINWIWYMLAVSDVPPILRSEDINVIIFLFMIILIVLIAQIILVEKCKMRGSYLLLMVGTLSSIVWITTYRGWNFNIGDTLTNLQAKRIMVFGMIISSLSVGSQLLQILLFYHRKKREMFNEKGV